MKSDGCDMVVLGTVIRETIGAMGEAKKLGWDVTFLGATPTNVLEVPALGKEAVEGLYAASGFEIPYEDTAKGKVKDWLANYKKMFSTDANTQAIIGYNAMMTFAFYANKAGKDLTGQKMLDCAGIRRQVPRHLQLAADQVLQDRPSRQHDHPGPADQERPLGAGQGRPDVLRERSLQPPRLQRQRAARDDRAALSRFACPSFRHAGHDASDRRRSRSAGMDARSDGEAVDERFARGSTTKGCTIISRSPSIAVASARACTPR